MEIRHFLTILSRHLMVFFLIFALIVGIPLSLSLMKQDVYKVSARILLSAKDNQAYMTKAISEKLGAIKALNPEYYYETFLELLSDPEITRDVLTKLSLEMKTSEFMLSKPYLSFLFSSGNKGIRVQRVNDSEVFEITAYAPDPEKADQICNLYMQTALNKFLDLYKTPARNILSTLKQKQENILRRIAEADQAQKAFMLKNQITDLDKEMSLLFDKQLYFEKSQFTNASALATYEQKQTVIQRLLKQIPEFRKTEETMSINPSILTYKANIAQLNLQLAELRLQYHDQHPRVQEITAQIEEAAESMKKEAPRFFSQDQTSLHTSYAGLTDKYWNSEIDIIEYRAAEAALKKILDEIQEKTVALSRAKIELDLRKEEIAQLKSQLSTNRSSIHEIEHLLEIDLSNAILLSPTDVESARQTPYFPDIPATLVLCGFLGGFLAFFGVLFVDYLSDREMSVRRIINLVPGAQAASVPDIRKFNPLKIMDRSNPNSAILHACLWGIGQKIHKAPHQKIIAIGSSCPGEGRTMVGLSLSRLLKDQGETVAFLDMSLWEPMRLTDKWGRFISEQIHRPVSIEKIDKLPIQGDVFSLLGESDPFSDVGVDMSPLVFIPSSDGTGASLSRTEAMDALARFFDMVKHTRKIDRVIMEVPPLSRDIFGTYVMEQSDWIVFVTRPGHVKRTVLETISHRLTGIKSPAHFFKIINRGKLS